MSDQFKECKFCNVQIPKSARFCSECNHYQNWRRYINISNSTLALIVALISIITAAAPVFQELLEQKSTKLTFTFLGPEDKGFSVLVTNEGNHRGIIEKANLKLNFRKEDTLYQKVNLKVTTANRIVDPSNSTGILLAPLQENTPQYESFKYLLRHMHFDGKTSKQVASVDDNYIVLHYFDQDGNNVTQELKIPSNDFNIWLNSIFPERNVPEGFR